MNCIVICYLILSFSLFLFFSLCCIHKVTRMDEFDEHVDFLLESGELPPTNMDLYDEFTILQNHDFSNLHNVRTYFENALNERESQMLDDDYGDDEVHESLQIVVRGLRNPEQVYPIDLEEVREIITTKMQQAPSRKIKMPVGKSRLPILVGGKKKRKTKKTTSKKIKNKRKTRKYRK